jgi:metal-responsive CopG/Arc/MetJ family transcriptional regulator
MAKAKLAITLESSLLTEVDNLVRRRFFPNRSRVIEEAVEEKLARLKKNRLARECANLDPGLEKAIAEEGMDKELNEWPEY